MRVVMVTKSSAIDSATLAEGETLASQGHEVIVLAARASNQPRFAQQGRVKIERYDLQGPGHRPRRLYQPVPVYIILAAWRFAVRCVRRVARAIARVLAWAAAGVTRAVFRTLKGKHALWSWEQQIAWRIEFYQPDVVQVRDRQLLPASTRGMHSDGQIPEVENACDRTQAWVVRTGPT